MMVATLHAMGKRSRRGVWVGMAAHIMGHAAWKLSENQEWLAQLRKHGVGGGKKDGWVWEWVGGCGGGGGGGGSG